jgi:hypothetical protein
VLVSDAITVACQRVVYASGGWHVGGSGALNVLELWARDYDEENANNCAGLDVRKKK